MQEKITNPFARLMGLRYKSHPWHGIDAGPDAPEVVKSFIEIVPSDTVKYEVDKDSGYLMIDRPQKFSNIIPSLYGFIPQTYCGESVAEKSRTILKRDAIVGDGDPLDILILTEKEITHGDILVYARPIGGFRMIDGQEADDKLVAVLYNDALYSQYKSINDVPDPIVRRLEHYFLTYKDMPGEHRDCEITHVYDTADAHDLIRRSMNDYKNYVEQLLFEDH